MWPAGSGQFRCLLAQPLQRPAARTVFPARALVRAQASASGAGLGFRGGLRLGVASSGSGFACLPLPAQTALQRQIRHIAAAEMTDTSCISTGFGWREVKILTSTASPMSPRLNPRQQM